MTSNAPALLRTYIVYGICLPLAVVLGYMLTSVDYVTLATVGLVLSILMIPFLLKWHHPILVTSWNMSMVLFFLPGRPNLWLAIGAMSLLITVLQGTISKGSQLPQVSSVMWPLLFLGVTTLVTAQLTGGIGIRTLGSGDVYGGKRYVLIFGSILAYFALAGKQIPRERAGLYVALFLLGGLTAEIGATIGYVSPSVWFIYLLFPIERLPTEVVNEAYTYRSYGMAAAGTSFFFFMLARYGVRGIMDFRKPWRVAVFVIMSFAGLLGGFRSTLIIYLMTFAGVFYLEGLHRTRMLAGFVALAVVGGAAAIGFAPQLPHSIQRTMAFIPWVDIDPLVRLDAEGSSEWRLIMWKQVLPEVPEHLLLGKGYSLSATELNDVAMNATFGFEQAQEGSILAGDYHNGPLSLVMPLGLWGVVGFFWLAVAGAKVLYANHRFGPPELQAVNNFLFASFVTKIAFFLLIFGSFYSDLLSLVGLIGLGMSLNGGVCRAAVPVPAATPASDPGPFRRPRPVLAR